MNLFHSLKCKGFSYSIVNAARSVLSTFMTVEGYDLDKHRLVCHYERTSQLEADRLQVQF